MFYKVLVVIRVLDPSLRKKKSRRCLEEVNSGAFYSFFCDVGMSL